MKNQFQLSTQSFKQSNARYVKYGYDGDYRNALVESPDQPTTDSYARRTIRAMQRSRSGLFSRDGQGGEASVELLRGFCRLCRETSDTSVGKPWRAVPKPICRRRVPALGSAYHLYTSAKIDAPGDSPSYPILPSKSETHPGNGGLTRGDRQGRNNSSKLTWLSRTGRTEEGRAATPLSNGVISQPF